MAKKNKLQYPIFFRVRYSPRKGDLKSYRFSFFLAGNLISLIGHASLPIAFSKAKEFLEYIGIKNSDEVLRIASAIGDFNWEVSKIFLELKDERNV